MKEWLAALMAMALLFCGGAFAEAPDGAIQAAIEDGSFVIRIPNASGDPGWVADDMAQDDSVVKLADPALTDGAFVVRYDPVGDGDVAVHVKHYTGIACDEVLGWDLTVRDGAVTDNPASSHTASPAPAEQDPFLSGAWLEGEDGPAFMDIRMNEAGTGWGVQIVSFAEADGFAFEATIRYDCDRNGFVYDDGAFWDTPVEEGETGGADAAGTTGILCFSGDDQDLWLSWIDDRYPDRERFFHPADAGAEIGPEDYEGEWIGVLDDGCINVDIESDGADYQVMMFFDTEEYTREFRMDFDARFDPEQRLLRSADDTVMLEILRDEDYRVTDEVVVYGDGASVFSFDDEGAMTWTDLSDGGYGSVALERPIGWVDPDYVGPGHHFVGEWNEERVSVVIEERMDEYSVMVSGANGANEGTVWAYVCAYDPETDSLISSGDVAYKFDYTIDDEGEFVEELIYDNGAAVFTIDADGRLIWDDRKENAGEDRAFERAGETLWDAE